MHAIILAAGYGTRLYPLTKETPKPLLPIIDKPIIEYRVEKIKHTDLDSISIVTNNKHYPHYLKWLQNSNFKNIDLINDNTNSNKQRLGGIKDLMLVIKKQHINEDILVLAADNLFAFDLQKFINFFRQNGTCIAVHDIKSKQLAKNYGVIDVKDKKLISFEEKPQEPKTTLVSTACYIISKDHLSLLNNYLAQKNNPEGIGYFIPYLMNYDNIYAYIFQEPWYDIGSIESYREANQKWNTI
ncbi:MAG: nucleotidyltransferase family protein [Candidatus Woesearchaeota archaeon]|nr:nucleotidyltransferase family protein [Candidatus Woesearchaeota archaeon]